MLCICFSSRFNVNIDADVDQLLKNKTHASFITPTPNLKHKTHNLSDAEI